MQLYFCISPAHSIKKILQTTAVTTELIKILQQAASTGYVIYFCMHSVYINKTFNIKLTLTLFVQLR